jgi:hypothetical protein
MIHPPPTRRPAAARGGPTFTLPKVRVFAAWHEGLNGGSADHLEGLSHPHVAVGGPCGTGRVTRLLRDRALRSGIRLVPARFFHGEETVVVEQEAQWSAGDLRIRRYESEDREAVWHLHNAALDGEGRTSARAHGTTRTRSKLPTSKPVASSWSASWAAGRSRWEP